NGDGSSDTDISRYGVLAKAGFSAIAPGGTPYFVLEMAVPVAGKYTFLSGRMTAHFYTETGTELSISDGEVTTAVVLTGGKVGTVISAAYVPVKIGIDVSTAIDLQKQGEVPVKIQALPGLDLRTLDISSIRLRDAKVKTTFVGSTPELPNFYVAGAKATRTNIRETGGAQSDLTVWFTTDDMKNLGGFTPATLSAALVAKTTDGKNLSGTTLVRLSN
ncbi:MAG: hypothetical protein V4671_13655, partial [Armatimonadota bacterium]